MYLSGEDFAKRFLDYFWFHHVTLFTVGFGDISPETDIGRFITVYWIMAVGICIFSTFIGDVIQKYLKINDDLLKGKLSFMKEKRHIVIFGNSKHAVRLIEQIRLNTTQSKRPIVLVLSDGTDPLDLPVNSFLVSVKSVLDLSELRRLSLGHALTILIDTEDDGTNIALCLIIQQILNKCPVEDERPSVLAMFHDSEMEMIVEDSCKDIECLSLYRNQVLATALTDIGTIKVNEAINCPTAGNATQFSKRLPLYVDADFTYGDLKLSLEEPLNITILGLESIGYNEKRTAFLNPPRDLVLEKQQRFFYIASSRLDDDAVLNLIKNKKKS